MPLARQREEEDLTLSSTIATDGQSAHMAAVREPANSWAHHRPRRDCRGPVQKRVKERQQARKGRLGLAHGPPQADAQVDGTLCLSPHPGPDGTVLHLPPLTYNTHLPFLSNPSLGLQLLQRQLRAGQLLESQPHSRPEADTAKTCGFTAGGASNRLSSESDPGWGLACGS